MQETTEQLELVVARCPYCELFTVKQITLTNHKTKRKMTHLCPTTRHYACRSSLREQTDICLRTAASCIDPNSTRY